VNPVVREHFLQHKPIRWVIDLAEGVVRRSILRVSGERWRKAQEWELRTWKRRNRLHVILARGIFGLLGLAKGPIGDDWNHWWREKFDNYKDLPNELNNAIELGCGPYTNIRLISKDHRIGFIVCSDPLARNYLRFRRSWLAQQHIAGNIMVDFSPAEDSPFRSEYFELVVLINVLDHVQDAEACLKTAIRLTKPRGYFVFGQDLTDLEDSREKGRLVSEDTGHPIRLHHEVLDRLLQPAFEHVLYRILPRELGRNPDVHYGTYLFIGRKRGSEASGKHGPL